jgi:hypothetical protein
MKLTPTQIGDVNTYMQSFDIKWYELEVELTDHFVSIIEEILSKSPELTFYQAKQYAENRFGRNEYKEIEKERTKILVKEYNRSQRKAVVDYLKFPKIIISFFGLIVVYKLSFYFENAAQYIKYLSSTFLILGIIHMVVWLLFRKIEGERFLSVEMTFRMNSSTLIGWYGLLMISKDYFQIQYGLLIACSLFVVGILLIVTAYHLTNKVISNTKKQYQLT